MDRRQNRTRRAVFQAVAKLLEQKHFDRITVQEIIDEADIGRSTFYTHFETKEHLLRCLFDYIFEQIQQETEEKSSLREMLALVLERARKYRQILQGLYAGSAGGACEQYIAEDMCELFRQCLPEADSEVPERFRMYYLTNGFADIIRWWVQEDCAGESEKIVEYYLKLTNV